MKSLVRICVGIVAVVGLGCHRAATLWRKMVRAVPWSNDLSGPACKATMGSRAGLEPSASRFQLLEDLRWKLR